MAKRAMMAGLRLGPVRLIPAGRDRYGRLLAQVTAGGIDLGCRQLRMGVARYIVRYDTGGRVRRSCKLKRALARASKCDTTSGR